MSALWRAPDSIGRYIVDSFTSEWSSKFGSFPGGNREVSALWCAPDGIGRYIVELKVFDGIDTSSGYLDIRVGSHPPEIIDLSVPFSVVGPSAAVILTCDASGIDGDLLQFSWLSTAGESSTGDTAGEAIWQAPEEPGTYRITVSVDDGFISISKWIELSIIPQIAIYSDSQLNHQVHRSVVASLAAIRPEVIFHAGDLTEDGLFPDN